MLELYHSGLTTCSKQIRLVLREKGLDYESRYIELWNYENLNKDYLQLNEVGVVPTLVHDGVPIRNSFVIAEYIEDVFPEPSLLPATALARAKMRLWTWMADDIHLSATAVTYNANLQGMVDELNDADKLIMLEATPVPDRRARWQKLADGGIASAAEYGVYGPEGVWLIEGHGVDPDQVVDNLPAATFRGQDAQLDAAIATLLRQLEEEPIPPIGPPAYPDKSK